MAEKGAGMAAPETADALGQNLDLPQEDDPDADLLQSVDLQTLAARIYALLKREATLEQERLGFKQPH